VAHEDASRYCPVCSQRLESRRCKLICPVLLSSCARYLAARGALMHGLGMGESAGYSSCARCQDWYQAPMV